MFELTPKGDIKMYVATIQQNFAVHYALNISITFGATSPGLYPRAGPAYTDLVYSYMCVFFSANICICIFFSMIRTPKYNKKSCEK